MPRPVSDWRTPDRGDPAKAAAAPDHEYRFRPRGPTGPRQRPDPSGYDRRVRSRHVAIVVAGVVFLATTCLLATAATAGAQGSSTHVSSIWLKSASYTPKAPPGATDDYHCTLLNPHLSQSSYIISSQFFPGSVEDHHAALFLLPPSLVATARKDGAFSKGWTCFGEGTLPNAPLTDFAETTLLSNWSPGGGGD